MTPEQQSSLQSNLAQVHVLLTAAAKLALSSPDTYLHDRITTSKREAALALATLSEGPKSPILNPAPDCYAAEH